MRGEDDASAVARNVKSRDTHEGRTSVHIADTAREA
jgi:hypothetical protein